MSTIFYQTLGFEVDFINSVQFSNHTGYGTWTGQVLHESELLELFSGLKKNELHRNYTHILTGYARSSSFLEAVHSVISEIKTISPNAIYCEFFCLLFENETYSS